MGKKQNHNIFDKKPAMHEKNTVDDDDVFNSEAHDFLKERNPFYTPEINEPGDKFTMNFPKDSSSSTKNNLRPFTKNYFAPPLESPVPTASSNKRQRNSFSKNSKTTKKNNFFNQSNPFQTQT